MRLHRIALPLFAALLFGSVSGSSLAQPNNKPDPAKIALAGEAFEEGKKLFGKQDYEGAAIQFEKAYRTAPNPAALTNAIKARLKANQQARAATHCALALAVYPQDQNLSKLAKQTLSSVEKDLGKVELTCSPECTVAADGKVISTEPVANISIYLDPGAHSIIGGWSQERTKSASVTLKKGDSQTISLSAPELPPAAVNPPKEKEGPKEDSKKTTVEETTPAAKPAEKPLPPWVFIAGAGVTAVMTGVTIWSGVDTVNSPGKEAVKNTCATGPRTACDSIYDEGNAKDMRTNVLIGVTAASAVATGVIGLFFTQWSSTEKQPTTGRIVPVRIQNGGGVAVLGSF